MQANKAPQIASLYVGAPASKRMVCRRKSCNGFFSFVCIVLCFKNSCLCISQWLLGLVVVEVFPVYSESLFHRGFLAHHQWTMNHPWLDGAFRWPSSRCHWSHAAPWWIFVGNSLDVPLENGTPNDNMQVWKLPNDPVEIPVVWKM